MNCQDRSKELGEKVQHGFVAPEAPKSGGAESSIKCESRGPLTCERHAGLFKIGSMFYLDVFHPKKSCRQGAALLGVQSSVVDSLRVDGDRTVLFQLRIGLQLRCPAVVALAAILLQDPKRCLS